jgi:hypothetical protein
VQLLPSLHVFDLLGIHGDTMGRDDMLQVGHRHCAKGAHTFLHRKLVVMQMVEDGSDVLQVGALGVIVNQNVVKEDKHKLPDEILQNIIHERLERHSALVRPNSITRNSKWSWCVWNTVFSMSTSFIKTWS